jgi:hypothetical protein
MTKHNEQVMRILEDRGPLTGKELLRQVPLDEFALWSACSRSAQIVTRIIGRRYLRLDAQVEAYARLSPSIMREFYGYTVIGTGRQLAEITRKAELLEKEIAATSARKLALAQNVIARLVESDPDYGLIQERACFMIAGDVVYNMAHCEPRPESSTGELVKGSDLDIIVVTAGLPERIVERLDAAIYDQKHTLLMNPAGREEIDYIVKEFSRVLEQLQFSSFKDMVAAKILDEAQFLYGSRQIFERVKAALAEQGIPEKLRALAEKALLDRANAEADLLNRSGSISREEWMKLFYTTEEKEEIF